MARSKIGVITTDLQSDSGSVLWSLVQGEALEFPITLSFLTNAYLYTYEAVVMEGLNVAGVDEPPTVIKPGGVATTLSYRVPQEKGTWASGTAYTREDVVLYSGTYYKLSNTSGSTRTNTTAPNLDPVLNGIGWAVYVPNKINIQFGELFTITPAWSVQPTAIAGVHGFFELRVTEPAGGIFQRTWKPMRGLVKVLFSPTAAV